MKNKQFRNYLDEQLQHIGLSGYGVRPVVAEQLGVHRATIDGWYFYPERHPHAKTLRKLIVWLNAQRKEFGLGAISAKDLGYGE